MARAFLDTNVLLYADDVDAGAKRARAREILRGAYEQREGVLSTQVLAEYFVNATRKLGLDAGAARERIEIFLCLEVVRIEAASILEAVDLSRLHGFSLWDCLILEAAAVSGCTVVYTEDLHHGQVVRGVEVVNPFA